MGTDPDAVIVGGRIGGCVTAILLASRGVKVRLLEAGRYPSDTLSTHFFRGDGLVRSLAEIGVLETVLQTGAPPLVCEYFSVDGGAYELGPPQEPGSIGYCLSVRRSTLDAILVDRAADVGVDVRTRTKVVDLEWRGENCVGAVDAHGALHAASVIVGADGRRSTVARLVRAADVERHRPARAMYYRYATDWPRPEGVGHGEAGPEFLLDGPDFAYAFPSDGGTTCLAVSLPATSHRSGPRPEVALQRRFRSNARTAERLNTLSWASRTYVGAPADSVWRESAGPGWALVGDAATSQDPWAGHGMDSAASQAEAFVEAFTSNQGAWQNTYETLRRQRTYASFKETALLAPDLRQLIQ